MQNHSSSKLPEVFLDLSLAFFLPPLPPSPQLLESNKHLACHGSVRVSSLCCVSCLRDTGSSSCSKSPLQRGAQTMGSSVQMGRTFSAGKLHVHRGPKQMKAYLEMEPDPSCQRDQAVCGGLGLSERRGKAAGRAQCKPPLPAALLSQGLQPGTRLFSHIHSPPALIYKVPLTSVAGCGVAFRYK